MNVYITKFNAAKIINNIDLSKVEIVDDLYKEKNRILNAMFSKYEKHKLLAFKKLMEAPEAFMKEVYEKIPQREDTYWWIYERNNPPAYHTDSECPFLKSNFKNYRIPAAIRLKGISKDKNIEDIGLRDLDETEKKMMEFNVKEYRDWWKVNEQLYLYDKETFLMRVNLRFTPEPRIREITEFEAVNSGIEEMNNSNLDEIENKIDQLITESGKYYYESEKHAVILQYYARMTNYLYNNKPIPPKDTGYSNEEIIEVLKDYDKRFKFPLKNYLKEYYRRKNNPELKMEEALLTQLGFRPCGKCVNGIVVKVLNERERIILEADEYNDMMFWEELNRDENLV